MKANKQNIASCLNFNVNVYFLLLFLFNYSKVFIFYLVFYEGFGYFGH